MEGDAVAANLALAHLLRDWKARYLQGAPASAEVPQALVVDVGEVTHHKHIEPTTAIEGPQEAEGKERPAEGKPHTAGVAVAVENRAQQLASIQREEGQQIEDGPPHAHAEEVQVEGEQQVSHARSLNRVKNVRIQRHEGQGVEQGEADARAHIADLQAEDEPAQYPQQQGGQRPGKDERKITAARARQAGRVGEPAQPGNLNAGQATCQVPPREGMPHFMHNEAEHARHHKEKHAGKLLPVVHPQPAAEDEQHHPRNGVDGDGDAQKMEGEDAAFIHAPLVHSFLSACNQNSFFSLFFAEKACHLATFRVSSPRTCPKARFLK